MKNLNATRKLLYDGSERDMPAKFIIKADSGEIELSRSEIYGTSFRELAAVLPEEDYKTIASRFTIERFGEIILYKVDELDVYYTIKNHDIIIISFGETQPDRYKIFLEDVWMME